MQKFCANCGAHHENKGFFCSPECRREFRNKKRSERAGKKCRLCGRVFPRPRVKQEQEDGVLGEHKLLETGLPSHV